MDFNTPFDSYASGCSREPEDVRFMYFSTEEVRAVSVKEITDVSPFTQTGEPLEGGLHDPHLGPLDAKRRDVQICKTCGLEKDCPGHMGHVELCCTVFNPTLMTTLLKLLQQSCHSCNRLRHDRNKTAQLVRQLEQLKRGVGADKIGPLISAPRGKKSIWESEVGVEGPGRVIVQDLRREDQTLQAQSLPDRTLAQAVDDATMLHGGIVAARERSCAEEARVKKEGGEPELEAAARQSNRDAASQERVRGMLASFMKDLPATCQNCKAKPVKWRRDGFSTLSFRRSEKDEEVALPEYLRKMLREIWRQEDGILKWMLHGLYSLGPEVFFLDALLVPPNRFRPPTENPGAQPIFNKQSAHLKELILANQAARKVMIASGTWESGQDVKEEPEEAGEKVPADAESISFKSDKERQKKALDAVVRLQLAVNSYMDSSTSGKHPMNRVDGVRQLLERKEGLFRMKMMGKRVNFAARSVISPDPNIETAEIGIPPFVATNLTYPEVAAAHNAEYLRELVARGPLNYPGATEVHVPLPTGGKAVVNLLRLKEEKRLAYAKQLVTDIESGKPPMTVFRQLRDGDPLLVNRQPTLHKPGIMAHVAKVLRHEKTIRMHYVNCNTYNADFDGDEMNLHAPQDPIGRTEALLIAKADNQYFVPTSGKPLRGLIQDYVIAGVMLTKRDTYIDRGTVCHLLYTGLQATIEGSDFGGGQGRREKLRRRLQRFRLRLDPPCVCRPRRLWSGKQLFTMTLKNLVEFIKGRGASHSGASRGGGEGLHLDSKSQTAGDIWNGLLDGNKEEASVVFRDGDLLSGVLDKKQFGASSNGIIHIVHEMFGARIVGSLLSAIARLFSHFLQLRGFTCAFVDLILRDDTEGRRDKLLAESRRTSQTVARKWLEENSEEKFSDAAIGPRELSDAAIGVLDQTIPAEKFESSMIGQMKDAWGQMINQCIPIGQQVPVPLNNFAAMVQTGAKGSKVNQSQICCCLGQQELEGRLPPLMATMRSLPCFAPYDLACRTRGYIADRFLTGIRPQEFFFHCMAGREGLVDTAVKTSRSGYLQRCLVKHLESLKISYDLSVRDNDGAVLQFLYGEDGQDVSKATFLYKFPESLANFHIVRQGSCDTIGQLPGKRKGVDTTAAPLYQAAREAAARGDAAAARAQVDEILRSCAVDDATRSRLGLLAARLQRRHEAEEEGEADGLPTPAEILDDDPVSSVLTPAHFFGATSQRHESELQDFLAKARKSGVLKGRPKAEAEEFAAHMRLKFMQGLAHPGEAVGVLAAQSMGEPSTQMTLNTFHLAGHGGANVTLGIPRLREIIQTGSKTCSTPLMKVQVLQDEAGDKSYTARMRYGHRVQKMFRGLTIMDCLSRLVVRSKAQMHRDEITWTYVVEMDFIPIERIAAYAPHINVARIHAVVRGTVCRKLTNRLMKVVSSTKARKVTATRPGDAEGDDRDEAAGANGEGGEAGAAAVGEEQADDGAQPAKKRQRRAPLGAEDRMADEEAQDDELEAGGDADSDGEESGMYDQGSSEEEQQPDAAAEDGPAPPVKRVGADDGAARGDDDDSGAEQDDADSAHGPPAQADEEGAKRKGAAQPEEPAAGGAAKRRRVAEGASGTAGAALAPDLPPCVQKAMAQGKLVWCSDLEGSHMDVVVVHQSSECPHKLDVGDTFRKICEETQLSDLACEGVSKVHVRDEGGQVWLECEGVNLLGLQSLPEGTVDHPRIYSNNILKLLESYGVEAARASVVKEIGEVFGHYGIEVDRRHLTVVADYMTHAGGLRAFSRSGMVHNASPLLQMSYETSCQFLTAACKDGVRDNMQSPASALIVGQTPNLGTGMVSLVAELNKPPPAWKQAPEFRLPKEALRSRAGPEAKSRRKG